MRGWLVPGFWPTTKIASRLLEVLELHRALADADGLLEPGAARLVAHVRAVRQVVRAERAREELVEERRLVARAARRVEEGLVRRGERAQLAGDEREGVLPVDGLVVLGARRAGPSGASRRPCSLSHMSPCSARSATRPAREEVGVGAARRRLAEHGLRAVLAELDRRRGRSRLGPRAAGAVEPRVLVGAREDARPAHEPRLRARVAQGRGERAAPPAASLGGADLRRRRALRAAARCGAGSRLASSIAAPLSTMRSAPAYTLNRSSRTKPSSVMPASRASSTARLDGGAHRRHDGHAGHRRLLDQLEARPPAEQQRRGRRAAGAPRAARRPTSLSTALCRPTSSRTSSSMPRASKSAARVQAPGRLEHRLRRAQGRRAARARRCASSRGPRRRGVASVARAPRRCDALPHTPQLELT